MSSGVSGMGTGAVLYTESVDLVNPGLERRSSSPSILTKTPPVSSSDEEEEDLLGPQGQGPESSIEPAVPGLERRSSSPSILTKTPSPSSSDQEDLLGRQGQGPESSIEPAVPGLKRRSSSPSILTKTPSPSSSDEEEEDLSALQPRVSVLDRSSLPTREFHTEQVATFQLMTRARSLRASAHSPLAQRSNIVTRPEPRRLIQVRMQIQLEDQRGQRSKRKKKD